MNELYLAGLGCFLLLAGFFVGWTAATKHAGDEISQAIEELGWNAKARDVWKRVQRNRGAA